MEHDHLRRYRARIAAVPSTVVLQPTTWCGLECAYCYLPDRRAKKHMTLQVAQSVARSIAELTTDPSQNVVDVVWHGGEPLSLGRRRLTELMQTFEPLRSAGRIRHTVQTNATMLSVDWCQFLSDFDCTVGVSIDGPAHLNVHRVDRHGRHAFGRILRGIEMLTECDIPFSVIAVVHTDSIDHPNEILDFLASLGCTRIGLNIEEAEGVNTRRPTNLSEATLHRCNMSGVVFRECEFRGTTFESGTYRRTDLRGNDLSTVRGGHRLDGVIISPSQRAALAHALIAELRPTLASEPDAGPGIVGL